MITNLHIKNFVIFKDVNIAFKERLTAITGQTGAGKSLLLEALFLLSGTKPYTNLVRNGENKLYIEATFTKLNNTVKKILEENEIEFCGNLIFSREISINNKSVIRVNGTVINTKTSKVLFNNLIDIHGQNESYSLSMTNNFVELLENDFIKNLLVSYKNKRDSYLLNKKNYLKFIEEKEALYKDKDYVEYQYNELVNLNLKEDEVDSITNEIKQLSSYQVLKDNYILINETIGNSNLLENLSMIKSSLNKISKIDNTFKQYESSIENSSIDINDLYLTIDKLLNNSYLDDSKINELNERLVLLKRIEKKYKKSINELIDYIGELKDRVFNFDNIDIIEEELYRKLNDSYQELIDISLCIRNERIKISKEKEKRIIDNLNSLMLKNVSLEFSFNDVNFIDPLKDNVFKEDGIDTCDMLVSFNPGEPKESISLCASGGEASRLSLAIKEAMYEKYDFKTLIFDEIDTGLSGSAADSIGFKLKTLSNKTQVITITHLPIVASYANTHLDVVKDSTEHETSSNIVELNDEERINKIVKMINPEDTSSEACAVAKKLLSKNI